MAIAIRSPRAFPVKVVGGTWLNHCTYQHGESKRLYRTETGAEKVHKLARTSVGRWADEPCRFLSGATIAVLKVSPPYRWPWLAPGELATVYLDEHLQTIAARRKQHPREKPLLADGDGEWFTDTQIQQLKGLRRGFCSYWRKHHSQVRKGEKALRFKLTDNANAHQGSPRTVHVYLMADVESILRGEEVGSSGQLGAGGVITDQDAKKGIKRILLVHGPLPADQLIARAAQQGISRARVYRAQKPLKIVTERLRKGHWYWRLPKQKPPAVEDRANLAEAADNQSRSRRGRPSSLERHQCWLEEHEAGKSLGKIALDEHVGRRAVADGIRKAREARASEVNSQAD